ncbi:putative transposase [Salmonella enterica]|nr:putative transposase [Salmonella enterica]SUH63941.1 putative transposase [Salmonella enterica subsp. enterica serovar Madelia]
MSGKRYPEAFKIKAVKQVIERGHSVSSVAHVLILLSIVFTPG